MSNQIHTYQHKVTLTLTLRTSHMMHENTDVSIEVHNLITAWISDKFKWEAFFDPQSHSPDISRMSPVLDRAVLDSVDVIRQTNNQPMNTWVHRDNEDFVDFINTDSFYKQDI